MFKSVSISLSVIGLAMITQTGVMADCNSSIVAVAPDSRYINHADGTVTDRESDLMWRQCSQGLSTSITACDTGFSSALDWQRALQAAETLNTTGGFAGHTDWRLPNKNELASLVEYQCFSPSINETVFPNTPIFDYWSSSPSTVSSGNAWYVNFNDGRIHSNDNKSNLNHVRLVRGGQ